MIFKFKTRKSQFLATFRYCDFSQSQFDFRAILQPYPFGPFYNPALSGDKKIGNDIWTIGNERMFDKKG